MRSHYQNETEMIYQNHSLKKKGLVRAYGADVSSVPNTSQMMK